MRGLVAVTSWEVKLDGVKGGSISRSVFCSLTYQFRNKFRKSARNFAHDRVTAGAVGRYCAVFGGILIEQSVEPHHVLEAAQALIDTGSEYKLCSQAQVIVKAQQKNEIIFSASSVP